MSGPRRSFAVQLVVQPQIWPDAPPRKRVAYDPLLTFGAMKKPRQPRLTGQSEDFCLARQAHGTRLGFSGSRLDISTGSRGLDHV